MTTLQSNTRLVLYVAISMLGSASAGLGSVNFSDAKAVWGFALGVLTVGAITARSYIDKTPSEIKPKEDQP